MTNGAAAYWVNPLRDKRDKRMPRVAGPCAVVIFGVTGDLARKKLMPAIYDLANRGLLAPQFALVGFARRDWADEHFGEVVHEAVKEHARTPFRQEVWDRLAEGIRFVHGDFDDDDAFAQLSDTLRKLDVERGTGGNHAFYLSIPPAAFPLVCEKLSKSGLTDKPDGCWSRVVIEKPFGHDLASAESLNAVVNGVFRSPRCSASTTTWVRKRSRICWRCGSPTSCSSRCGTPTTSTTCRSPWPRTSD